MAKHKPEAYEQAVIFRKRGFTYAEIAKICNVSRGTVSNWLAHEEFSKLVATENKKRAVVDNTKRLASINKARTTERKAQYTEITRLAKIEYQNYRTSPLFMAGLMLYSCEGDLQNERLIRLTSTRIDLHRVFISFLTTYLGVAKPSIRFWLLLYPDLDEVACMKHWCKKTTLSPAQFYKNQVIQGISPKRTLHFGIGNTIIGSTLLKKKLLTWTKLATKELLK